MAKAKYTRRPDGRFYTTVWDGTYNANGTKHRIPVYTRTSSGDLERKVNKIKADVEAGRKEAAKSPAARNIDVYLYAQEWYRTYKSHKQGNTRKCMPI